MNTSNPFAVLTSIGNELNQQERQETPRIGVRAKGKSKDFGGMMTLVVMPESVKTLSREYVEKAHQFIHNRRMMKALGMDMAALTPLPDGPAVWPDEIIPAAVHNPERLSLEGMRHADARFVTELSMPGLQFMEKTVYKVVNMITAAANKQKRFLWELPASLRGTVRAGDLRLIEVTFHRNSDVLTSYEIVKPRLFNAKGKVIRKGSVQKSSQGMPEFSSLPPWASETLCEFVELSYNDSLQAGGSLIRDTVRLFGKTLRPVRRDGGWIRATWFDVYEGVSELLHAHADDADTELYDQLGAFRVHAAEQRTSDIFRLQAFFPEEVVKALFKKDMRIVEALQESLGGDNRVLTWLGLINAGFPELPEPESPAVQQWVRAMAGQNPWRPFVLNTVVIEQPEEAAPVVAAPAEEVEVETPLAEIATEEPDTETSFAEMAERALDDVPAETCGAGMALSMSGDDGEL